MGGAVNYSQRNLFKMVILYLDDLKGTNVPQAHVLGQTQREVVPRRPHFWDLVLDLAQPPGGSRAVGFLSGHFPVLVAVLLAQPHHVPLRIHRNAVGYHRDLSLFLLGVLSERRGDDAVIRIGQISRLMGLSSVDTMARVGVGRDADPKRPRQSDPHQHRRRHHDPRDGRRHTALPHTGKEGGDLLPRRRGSHRRRLGQRGGEDHVVVQTFQQFKGEKPLDLVLLHT